MSTHNICFDGELTKIILQLTSNILNSSPGSTIFKDRSPHLAPSGKAEKHDSIK